MLYDNGAELPGRKRKPSPVLHEPRRAEAMNPWVVLGIGLVLMAIGASSPFGSFGGLFLIAGFVMLINAARIIFRRK